MNNVEIKRKKKLSTHEKEVEIVAVTFLGKFKLTDYIHNKMLKELNS